MSRVSDEYSSPLCVWKIIEESVSPEKLPIIRSLIGEAKLDYAADLRCELETLLEIWGEINFDTILTLPQYRRQIALPEPPQQRELLIREIQLLLKSMNERENQESVVIPHDCNEDIINYTNHISGLQTPPTPTPILRSVSRSSSTPLLDDNEIGDVAKNIAVLDLETPVDVLKIALQCECDLLAEDIEYIRKCVEEGHCDFEEPAEPSLTELRQERKKLENYFRKSMEISPVLSKGNTKVKGISSPVKSGKSTTSVRKLATKNKDLPPIRPSSAMQYSRPKSGEVSKTNNVSSSNPPKVILSPKLGTKSHTFPSEISKKNNQKLKRRNSLSSFPSKSELLEHWNQARIDSTTSLFSDHARKNCGTPDSGMSSRPVSQMGLYDSFSDDMYAKSAGLSQNFSASHKNSSFRSDHTVVNSDVTQCHIPRESGAFDEGTSIPKPPSIKKPNGAHRTRFHRVKAMGTRGSN